MYENLYGQLQVLERKDAPLSQEERLKAANRPLLYWYEKHARKLPWRENKDPYRIWISEIMLQQTRVEAVKPYFQRFLKEFPDIPSLAAAEEDRLLKLWEGLGYYSRARNLQKCAKVLTEDYGGRMPADYKELLKLPGIGSYTAGAIASIAFSIPVPAVDGNVLRVVSRFTENREDMTKPAEKKKIGVLLTETMDRESPGDFNQALIEVGAIVCVPNGEPKCMVCPLASLCLVRRDNLWQEIPFKPPKRKRRMEQRTVFVVERKGKIAVRKRPPKGLLASLYELPNVEGKISEDRVSQVLEVQNDEILHMEVLPEAKHIFSHVEWDMTGYLVRLSETKKEDEKAWKDWIFVEKDELKGQYPLPNAFQAYRKFIK